MALLELKNLKTFFATKRGTVKAVNGVSYSLDAGKVLGVVGESGSGKSVSAMSILRLLDGNGYIDSGEILFNGVDLTKLSMNGADDESEPGLHRQPSDLRAAHDPSGHEQKAGRCESG